jgi:hypothetical protein
MAFTLLLGTVVMLATALTVTAMQGLPGGQQSAPPVATVAAAYVNPAAAAYTIPSLSAAQKQQVSTLALADAQVVRLLQKGPSPS